uniref:DELTA-sagatoxin-Srs1a-like n=1 Tax=Oreochromis niloticus TaxID=8128 RepID=A0A669F4P2_ORENI
MGPRQSAIHITNRTKGYILRDPRRYLVSGNCQIPLPATLGPSECDIALFSKTDGTARGSVGVFTYDLYDKSANRAYKKIAVMFSVPFDYNLSSNWYAVGVFDRKTNCDNDLYDKMYYSDERGFVRGKAGDHDLTYTDDDVTVKSSMTNSSVATLKVDVHN